VTLKYFKSHRQEVAVAVIIIVGLAARLYNADYNFDGDEVFSARLADNRLSEVIAQSLTDRPHPPLYYIMLHFWISAFGTSEVAVRSLSVFFSGGFLVTSYILLRYLVSQWAALGALLFLAISPFFVYYGLQARPYSLIAFLSSVNLLMYMRFMERASDRRRLIIWAVSCALLIYSQYLAALVIGLEILVALMYLPSGRLRMAAFGAGAVLCIVPWVMACMGSSFRTGTDPLGQVSWITEPNLRGFTWFYVSLFGEVPSLRVAWLAIMLVALTAPYAISVIRRETLPFKPVFFVMAAVGIPVFCYLISVWGPKPVFVGRQMIAAGLSVFLVIALCLEALPRTVAAGFTGALALWMAVSLPGAFPQNSKPPWREAARAIDARYGSVDVFTEEEWVNLPLGYYRRKGHVLLWDKAVGQNKHNTIVAICRPFDCLDFESGVLASRRSLVATWSNVTEAQDHLGTRTLHLYEIAASP
jgi:hypothetical protein